MNKKILLIDADSKIPNIALGKISTYHKKLGDEVFFEKLNLPYYPGIKKEVKYFLSDVWKFDKIYCSIIFDVNKEFVKGKDIIFGGTGYDLKTKLPDEIEQLDVDYSLYPDNSTSYGFITRGCIRDCYFCKVPKKEGNIHKVNDVDDIVRHKNVKFLDNNILAFYGHKKILQELIDKKIRCQFNQGLDIRLIDDENAFLLSKMCYLGEYIFAFDDWNMVDMIEKQVSIFLKYTKRGIKFFLYVNDKMKLSNIVKRIEWIKKNNFLPYLMRDISCWGSEHKDFYTSISSYCNQPNIFKMGFEEFVFKRHFKERADKTYKLYVNNMV